MGMVKYYSTIGRPSFRPGPEFGPCVYRCGPIHDVYRTSASAGSRGPDSTRSDLSGERALPLNGQSRGRSDRRARDVGILAPHKERSAHKRTALKQAGTPPDHTP